MIEVAGALIDPTITMGNIVEIVVIVGGGFRFLSKFTTKFALLSSEFAGVKTDMTDMKSEIKKVNEVLAKANESERRIGRLEDLVHELQRGEAWVTSKRTTVNGEYK